MDLIKEKRISKNKQIRLENLHNDLNFLREKGYQIVDVNENLFRFEIVGTLYDYQNLNALCIFSYYRIIDGIKVITLILEY